MSRTLPDAGLRRRPRRRRLRRAILIVAAVVAAGLIASALIPVSYYAITPGTATEVGGFISVPSARSHHHRGQVLLTDVELVPLRAIDYLFYKWNGDDDVEPTVKLLGPSTTSSQYEEQGTIDMATARQAATVVALKSLGYKVSAVPSGVVDYEPEPGSPAAAALRVGDVITAVGRTRTPSYGALASALGTERPGNSVQLTFHYLGSSKVQHRALLLGRVVSDGGGEKCVPSSTRGAGKDVTRAGRPLGCLGIYLQQLYATEGAPFGVNIQSEGIIGPSAGLAFTLGLIQKLDRDDLTAGKLVAATGTMAIDGQVGDVGGVAQKTVAVRNAGAVLFLVPPQELSVARAHAGSHLKVVAVSDIAEALSALRQLGGRVAR